MGGREKKGVEGEGEIIMESAAQSNNKFRKVRARQTRNAELPGGFDAIVERSAFAAHLRARVPL
jgi:hypothetical protein